jgi:hypothetical protein
MIKLLLVLISLFLYSCGTTPPNTLSKLIEKKLPGYWVDFKSNYGGESSNVVESFVHISCDGEIRYEINEPYALLFKKSNDDGKIKSITEDSIEYRSWIGFTWKDYYSGPVKNDDGCFELRFKGKSFVTSAPIDCTKPPPSLSDAFEAIKTYFKGSKAKACN